MFTTDRGRTSPGSQQRIPLTSLSSFFGVKTIVASLNGVLPKRSNGNAANMSPAPTRARGPRCE